MHASFRDWTYTMFSLLGIYLYIFVFSQVKCSDVRVNGELTPKVIVPMCFKAVYPVLYLVTELIRNWFFWWQVHVICLEGVVWHYSKLVYWTVFSIKLLHPACVCLKLKVLKLFPLTLNWDNVIQHVCVPVILTWLPAKVNIIENVLSRVHNSLF